LYFIALVKYKAGDKDVYLLCIYFNYLIVRENCVEKE